MWGVDYVVFNNYLDEVFDMLVVVFEDLIIWVCKCGVLLDEFVIIIKCVKLCSV